MWKALTWPCHRIALLCDRVFCSGTCLCKIQWIQSSSGGHSAWRVFLRSSSGRSAGLTMELTNPAMAMTALEGGVSSRVNIVWHLVWKLWLECKCSNKKTKKWGWQAISFLVFALFSLRGVGTCAIHWETSSMIFDVDFLLFSEKNDS